MFQIIVHVGAGPGLDPSSHASQVKIAIERGLIVYNVAVGDGWTQSILSQYADIPPSRYSLPVAYFFLLDDALASLLAQRIINGNFFLISYKFFFIDIQFHTFFCSFSLKVTNLVVFFSICLC